MGTLRFTLALGLALVLGAVISGREARADEDWVIRSFDVTYTITEDGVVAAVEDIRVDFGSQEKHGIFRDMPAEYAYDEDSNRQIAILGIRVDDGSTPVPFETTTGGPNIRIKIGDPDKTVTGEQRYRISYTISGGLNPFPDHDQLYWNVTGHEWPVDIERASATVVAPGPGIEQTTCFQGPPDSTDLCASSGDETTAGFRATGTIFSGSDFTIVVALQKGLVQVPPPVLVKPHVSDTKTVGDFFKFTPIAIGLAALTAVAVVAALARLWWLAGRDRWFGDMAHVIDSAPAQTKPLFARETIVVEFQPPEVERRGRRLRPAEIGLLVDERADTLDVSASIVDLAVRNYLVIKEVEKDGIFGAFKKQDYELQNLSKPEDELLPYEQRLLQALFDGKETMKLSDLKNKFHDDLAEVKKGLYEESTKQLKFFPTNPETIRTIYRVAGGTTVAVGVGVGYLLGLAFGAAFIGIPIVIGGVLLFLFSHLMPRRTAEGRQMYRRAMDFRKYMVTAEKERQKFAEKANIFHEYLPYAIVYGCVDKWAEAFEGLDAVQREASWYQGRGVFIPTHFASSVSDFSSSISGVMASTPGGRGGSGFGGGGGSGGGGGGGGGGSW